MDSSLEATEQTNAQDDFAKPSLVFYSREGSCTIELPESGTLTVGRSAQAADVVIADQSLSRLHARFAVEDGGIRVEDASTTNGTFVRGQRVSNVVVSDGVEVRLILRGMPREMAAGNVAR